MSALSATYRSRQKVLGYPVDVVDEAMALDVVEAAWRSGKGIHIVTLNAEMVVQAQENQELDRIIRHAHLIIPDGAGVVWALKLQGQQAERLAGIDLAGRVLSRAASQGRKVALLGGKAPVLDKCLSLLPKLHPGLNIVASHDGYFTIDEEEEVIDQIAESDPELILFALGVPKQEFIIDKWQHAFPRAVLIGVGGSFDVWAGTVKRAPVAFQRMHLEWLHRLISEPWRFKRMSQSLPRFGVQVLSASLKKRHHAEKETRKQNGE